MKNAVAHGRYDDRTRSAVRFRKVEATVRLGRVIVFEQVGSKGFELIRQAGLEVSRVDSVDAGHGSARSGLLPGFFEEFRRKKIGVFLVHGRAWICLAF